MTGNRIIIGDNLAVMRGMESASVDLIYLDPPFNSKKTYSAPIGSEAAGAAFKDTWTLDDVDDAWLGEIAETSDGLYSAIQAAGHLQGDGTMAYLTYMAVRLMEMKRLLKDTGSVYLHCDPTASHYLKLLMDGVFGGENFQNHFIWHYGGGGATTKRWGRKHDDIIFYSKGSEWVFNADAVREPHKWNKGQKRADGSKRSEKGKIADDVWRHHAVMPWAKERIGYPTQKPLALLERIIKASSNEGDTVLDPFCGCATTCVAADKLNRKWIGIDISLKAGEIVAMRMKKELGLFDHNWKLETVEGRIDPAAIEAAKSKRRRRRYNSPENKRELFGEQAGRCAGCGLEFAYRNLTVDHVISQHNDGSDDLSNLQLICSSCNSTKGGKRTQREFIHALEDKRILTAEQAEAQYLQMKKRGKA